MNINWYQTPTCHPKLRWSHTWLTALTLQRVYDSVMSEKKTYSILYHGPVWITLNSFIWNIKTMKHKPSTKSDSYKCRIIRLLKWTGYTGKQQFFFSLDGEADTQNRQWNVNMIMPFTRSKSYLTARRKKNKRKKRKKKRGKQKKMEQRYSSDDSLVSLWRWLWPGI